MRRKGRACRWAVAPNEQIERVAGLCRTIIATSSTKFLPGNDVARSVAPDWDPQLPQSPAQANCPDDLPHPDGSCTVSFIGDYFGAALGNGNLYVLNVSTHNFGGNGYIDQQQVLQIVPLP
jgi:hypothetical protein